MPGIDAQQRRDKRAEDDRNRGLEAYQRQSVRALAEQMSKLPEVIGEAVATSVAARAVAFVRSDESGTATATPTEVLDGASVMGGTATGPVLGWEFENTSVEPNEVEGYTPRIIWYYAYEPGETPPEPETGNPNGHPGNGWRYLGPGDEKIIDTGMSLMVLRDGEAGNDLPFSLFVKRATS